MSKYDMLPMDVKNMGFLIDRLHKDCSPLQFLRELTMNAIEGIQQLENQSGEIIWEMDWNRFDLTKEAQYKLCIIDTGIGMTGEEMVEYINRLSSSIHEQSRDGNFGVGAKISAAPLNPEGLIYLSWKNGKGYMIHLCRDFNTGTYGLKRFDNSGEYWTTIDNDIKPKPIMDHGTMVVLLGKNKNDNTMKAPPGAATPSAWIVRYLNSRFFRFPDNIDVKVRLGWERDRENTRHNYLRKVTGQEVWLNKHSKSSGFADLTETHARVHWWIIKEEVDDDGGQYIPKGHIAALYQDELYERARGKAGYARLRGFGIIFGCERVVIYLEPKGYNITANTARSNLMINNQPLNWADYAKEFRDNLPLELEEYETTIGEKAGDEDYRKSIQDRLKSIRDLYKFPRYKKNQQGEEFINDNIYPLIDENNNYDHEPDPNPMPTPPRPKPVPDDIYEHFANDGNDDSDQSAELKNDVFSLPDVKWVSERENTRDSEDIKNRAALYAEETNKLLINKDFRIFTDMINRWEKHYINIPGSLRIIEETVQEWFEQQLVEVIMSAWALKQALKLSTEELKKMLDEESLTAAIMPRYHINMNIKRSLGQRLGKQDSAA